MSRTRLSLTIVAVVVVAAIAAIVATTGSSAKKAPGVAPHSALAVRQTSLGQTLADENGRTLYLFEGDKPNVSTLSAAGRAVWPPFTAATKPLATGAALVGKIGAVTGATGVGQVTYNGHPLYYFVGDRNPGQTSGQGLNEFGGRWYVLSPSGAAITSAPSARTSTPSTGGGLAYGY
jgi:predicted lipoprotein with Yx(FWY)xxD motif